MASSNRLGRKTATQAVVIGGSAGGLDAVGTLLERLPREFACPVLVVIHMPASNDDLLARVLSARCALPVREAEDKEQIVAGIVYIAPAGYHLLIEPDRTIALSLDEPVNYSRPSIDLLFESAAYAFGPRLLAIVLSGANADGAQGLSAVRSAGGAAWVQDPSTAVASLMPASALSCAGADRVMSLHDLAEQLARLAVTEEQDRWNR